LYPAESASRRWQLLNSYEDLAFFFQADVGIRYLIVTGVQTCALPISGFEGLPAGVTDNLDLIEVIHAGAAESAVAGGKTRGLDQIGRASCRERVDIQRGDVLLHYTHDLTHIPLLCCSRHDLAATYLHV